VTRTQRPIVAVTRTALPGDGIPALRELADVRVWAEDRNPAPAELLELATDATIILGPNGDRIDATVLDALPMLELIAIASAGYDTIDAAAAAERGVRVTHTPGVLHEATADLAFGLLLAARRRIAEADRWVRAGGWHRVDLRNMVGYDVHGATIGITGRGGIVVEAALVTALREGWIASAGLDVQVREPNPDPDDPLLGVDNCVVVPHIGSATHAARAGMFDLAAANARDYLAGGTVRTPVPETRAMAGIAITSLTAPAEPEQ
jgi:glyoxylate reductase